MGRHSAGDDRVFYRSLALTIAKWVTVALLPLLAAVGIWKLLSKPDEPADTPRAAAVVSPSPQPTPSPVVEEPTPGSTPIASPSPSASAGQVQVLNGSGTPGMGTAAAKELEEEGYEIVATGNAVREYEKSTVFYQPGFEQAARQVARIVGATVVQAAPSSLDKKIALTLVVGLDYKP